MSEQKKIAVMLAQGYEEGESLFLTDILRRAGFYAETVSITDNRMVTGAHGITVQSDRVLPGNEEEIGLFDMIILPGGMPGAANLKACPAVIKLISDFDRKGKWIGAICAAPMVLAEAGISRGRRLTSYPADSYRALFTDADYREETVVVDRNLITSRGPATTLPFAYTIVDCLGGDSAPLKKGMLYQEMK